MGESLSEWLALGLLLQQLRPDRFDEVVVVLRETVALESASDRAVLWIVPTPKS